MLIFNNSFKDLKVMLVVCHSYHRITVAHVAISVAQGMWKSDANWIKFFLIFPNMFNQKGIVYRCFGKV